MKTILLVFAVALTGLGLRAQTPPPAAPAAPAVTPTTPAAPVALPGRTRPQRFGTTNSPFTTPRFTPPGGTAPGAPGATPAATAAATAATAAALAGATGEETIPPGTINFQGVSVEQVLEIYAQLVGRTLIRAALPDAKIILKTQTPLTKSEAIQALQAVLAMNNISLVNIGEKFVKVVTSDQANAAAGEIDQSTNSANLPNLGTYVTHIRQLHYVKPSLMVPLLTPFAKLPNSVFPIDDNGILIMRDYAENVKRMLEMVEKIDVSVPAEYISEVIPIRYAKVDEIASALNSLGGSGGGATVSIGSGTTSPPISGFSSGRTSGIGGGGIGGGGVGGAGGNPYQPGGIGGGSSGAGTSPFGTRTSFSQPGATGNPSGTATTGSSFASRLNNIINRASTPTGGGTGQDQILLFGQTKIIPNLSSSTLLVYATRRDMEAIREIIAKLDVPLAQVLIEAVIIDYTLGNTFNFGVSAAQNPKTFTPSTPIVGAGGMNNSSGSPFLNFLSQATNGVFTQGSNSAAVFGNILAPKAFSYFGNIGPTWDVAVTAAQSDSHASIMQRPRIQASQAQPAQFFVGSTVPYITGNYSYYGGGPQNSYSQLSVGVELDVTPFINPDGVVTMQIMQQIDEVSDKNYNNTQQPSTIKRTLNTTMTVRDRDTVMIGGFIKSNKSTGSSGVPFLSDIPLLGNLFKQRTDSKDRQELIVLMRPTVLATPKIAAENTIKEEQRLPGISQTTVENAVEERKLIDAQRKREEKEFKKTKQYDGFFTPPPMESATNAVPATNAPANVPTGQTSPASNPSATDTEAQAQARAAMQQQIKNLDTQPAESVPPPAPR